MSFNPAMVEVSVYHIHCAQRNLSTFSAPNFVNPPVRDVIGVGGGGVRIRFRADNPGPWFLHCHIDWHLEAGLAVVFAEAPQDQRTGPDAQIIKDTWVDLCTIYKNLPADEQ
ncbi:multicopper oxidase [Sphaerobolus stellatus SS14]|nr:multicopper oxidase [Sphaerobolus stellatus SS14]